MAPSSAAASQTRRTPTAARPTAAAAARRRIRRSWWRRRRCCARGRSRKRRRRSTRRRRSASPRRRRALPAGGGGGAGRRRARRRRRVPVLRAISVAWAYNSSDVAVAAAACGALASARGDGHADARRSSPRGTRCCARAATRRRLARPLHAPRAPPHRHSAEGDELHCAERVARGLMGRRRPPRLTEAAAARAAPRFLVAVPSASPNCRRRWAAQRLQRLDASRNRCVRSPAPPSRPCGTFKARRVGGDLTDLHAGSLTRSSSSWRSVQPLRGAAAHRPRVPPSPRAQDRRRSEGRPARLRAKSRPRRRQWRRRAAERAARASRDGSERRGGAAPAQRAQRVPRRRARVVQSDPRAAAAARRARRLAQEAPPGVQPDRVARRRGPRRARPAERALRRGQLAARAPRRDRLARQAARAMGARQRAGGAPRRPRPLRVAHGDPVPPQRPPRAPRRARPPLGCRASTSSTTSSAAPSPNCARASSTACRCRTSRSAPTASTSPRRSLPDARVGLGWNRGVPPACCALTDRFAAADALFEPAAPACAAAPPRRFLGAGPGMQQWHAPAAAARGGRDARRAVRRRPVEFLLLAGSWRLGRRPSLWRSCGRMPRSTRGAC